MHSSEGTARNYFFDLPVVLAVPVLVADHSLDPGGADGFANFERLIHGKRDGFFVGDELCAALNAKPNELQTDLGRGGETKDIGSNVLSEAPDVG